MDKAELISETCDLTNEIGIITKNNGINKKGMGCFNNLKQLETLNLEHNHTGDQVAQALKALPPTM